MSQQNVEFAWQASGAWNDGGLDAFVQYLDADVEWHPPAESMEPGIYRGHASGSSLRSCVEQTRCASCTREEV